MAALGEAAVATVCLDVPQVDVVDLVRVVVGDCQDVIGAGRGKAADAQGEPVLRAGIKSCIKLQGDTLDWFKPPVDLVPTNLATGGLLS